MANVHKIFVEPDEEIVFTIEKIVQAAESRAILVVPKNAALVSSAVSLKLLTKQMLRTTKLAVLVTEDEIGRRLAEKAALVAVGKISEVTKDVWVRAKEIKQMQQSEKERVRDELVGARKEEKVTDEPEIAPEPVKAVLEEEDQTAVAPETRVDVKAVDLEGILLFAGGDITDNPELMENERLRLEEEPDISGIDPVEPQVEQATFKGQGKNLADLKRKADNAKQDTPAQPKKALIGRDLTAMMAPKEPKRTQRTKRQAAAVPPVIEKVKAAAGRFLPVAVIKSCCRHLLSVFSCSF
ncbi:MAG: hypothetical protein TR69_WS6001000829 [candidate division WS6 bacterium OLB20]|uniref:Uncharacterized protein n=1 Tax=candidate division WS6 bacterium OLB20 TaxID=1617426 RepID=A0A136LYS3_9BACT|nr:MAG: hypothetical protein TR69_WS6001000829 [candidate division WS6 bacterium OLB20]